MFPLVAEEHLAFDVVLKAVAAYDRRIVCTLNAWQVEDALSLAEVPRQHGHRMIANDILDRDHPLSSTPRPEWTAVGGGEAVQGSLCGVGFPLEIRRQDPSHRVFVTSEGIFVVGPGLNDPWS